MPRARRVVVFVQPGKLLPRGAEEEALHGLAVERVRQVLQQLSPDQQAVLLLRILGRLTVEEVAHVAGKSPGAVKALQRRGLRSIERALRGGRTPMSDHDAYRDDMRRLSDLDDRELDLVLAHEPPRADEREELVAFIQDLRRSLEEGPAEATAAAQLAAIVDAARLHAHHEGAAVPGGRSPRTTSRRMLVRRNPFSSLPGRFAALAALALFLAASGGIAYAGELPGPVQGSVADLAGVVGLSINDGDDADVDSGDVDQADLDQADVDDVDEIELPNDQPLEVETDEAETDEAEQNDADVDEADVNEPEDNDAHVDEPEDNNADADEPEDNDADVDEVETNEVETNEVEADVDDSESDEPQSGGEQGNSGDDQSEPGTDGDD